MTGTFSGEHHEISDLCMDRFRISKKERRAVQPDKPAEEKEEADKSYAWLFAPRDSEDFFRELRLRNITPGDS